MAERNLAIRLSVVDGGKVKAELSDVGEAGEKSLKRIEAASQPASAGLQIVSKAANDAFAQMEDATSRLGLLGSVLGKLGPAGLIAGASIAAAGYGMHQLIVPVAEVGEELNKLSQKTAVSVEALSALLYAARRQADQITDPGLKAEAIELINHALSRQLPVIVDLARANAEYQRSFDYGMRSSVRSYVEDSTNAAKQAERAVTSAFKGMEDALVQFVTTGKLDFSSLANSIIADLVRIQIQRMVTLPLAGWLGGLGSTPTPTPGGSIVPIGATDLVNPLVAVAHTGGLIGSDSLASRSVGLHNFAGATRYHTGGLVEGEVPIIAQPGEAVFTPGQMRALGGALSSKNQPQVRVAVNVINNASGVDARVQSSQQADGSMRLDIIVEQIEARMSRSIGQGTGIAPTLERRYGLNPAAGAMR